MQHRQDVLVEFLTLQIVLERWVTRMLQLNAGRVSVLHYVDETDFLLKFASNLIHDVDFIINVLFEKQ